MDMRGVDCLMFVQFPDGYLFMGPTKRGTAILSFYICISFFCLHASPYAKTFNTQHSKIFSVFKSDALGQERMLYSSFVYEIREEDLRYPYKTNFSRPGVSQSNSIRGAKSGKMSMICLVGKSITPYWGNTILICSSQQLPVSVSYRKAFQS